MVYNMCVNKKGGGKRMHLTREADYALRIMYTLAQAESHMGAAAISDRIAVSKRFTLKILSGLANAGLVRSKLGAGGGYALSKPASHITVADVLCAVEGPMRINPCLAEGYRCERVSDCAECVFHCMFDALNRQITEKLQAVTIEDAATLAPSDLVCRLSPAWTGE